MERISLEKAQSMLLEKCSVMEKELVPLREALGKILGESIEARENIPPFARSPYDGYALMASDTAAATQENPATLEVIEEVPAGYVAGQKVTPGKAVKILTGAPVPEGADVVIQFEETKVHGQTLNIFFPLKAGKNIVPLGEDVREGDCVAQEGIMATAPVIGLLASLGIKEVTVYRRPKIAIISIGDELLDINEPLTPGKIRNSNSYTLASYCKELGVEPVIMGTARDRVDDVAELMEQGLKQGDLVITSGGASVGDYDVTGRALEKIGAQALYQRIEIKPGSPALAAIRDGKIILGLSGNPAASATIFQLVATPLIKKIAGRCEYLPRKVEVILKEDFKKKTPTRRFLRGKLDFESGLVLFESTGAQGNGVLRSLVSCNVLAEIPSGSGYIMAGERLTAYLLNA